MQTKCIIPISPIIPDSGIPFHNQGMNSKMSQPSRDVYGSMTTTHNQHVRFPVYELYLALSLFQPPPMIRKLVPVFAQSLRVVLQPREARIDRVSFPLSRRRLGQPEDASAQSVVANVESED